MAIGLLATSCYAPLTPPMRKQVYKDSTLTVYERYPDGSYRCRKDYEFKSARKTVIEEKRFVKGPGAYVFDDPRASIEDTLASPGPTTDTLNTEDSTTTVAAELNAMSDTLTEAEITNKQFKIDDNIFIQRQRFTSYQSGTTLVKEKTRKRSKFRENCEIVTYKRTKIYNEFGDVVFKENLNPFYWRQVRFIYDEGGKRLEKRVVKFMFKPKFRNYP